MTLPKGATLGIIILAAFLIIGIILGMKYLQVTNTSQGNTTVTSPTEAPNNAGIANPASAYCQEQGGKSEIITASDGSQGGRCVFSDGRRCDEWQFFRTRVCN